MTVLVNALTCLPLSPKTSPMPTRRITRARARGLQLVSQILLALQIFSLGHLLSSQHVTCPEHGDIIHIEHSETTSPSQVAADGEGLVRRSVAPAGPAADTEHDACRVCADTSRRCLLTGPTPTFAHHVSVAPVVHARGTVGFAPIDLILLSPKNSPPAA
jgi:hypothetical protein